MNLNEIEMSKLLDEVELHRKPFDYKKYLKKVLKKAKAVQDSKEAKVITAKFLDENPHVNIGFVIKYLQSMILSTTQSSEKLGISPTAFSRLRKKYNIFPVYTVQNNGEYNIGLKKPVFKSLSKFLLEIFILLNN